jgi:hypothetical protein
MNEVTTITLDRRLASGQWRWHSLTGLTGCCAIEPLGVEAGDELTVELRWQRATWRIVGYRRIPGHAWHPDTGGGTPAPAVTVGGVALWDAVNQETAVRPGQVRSALATMNPRSTGEADAGRTGKVRPCVVRWVDPSSGHAGIHFLYDVDSAVRRGGAGRRPGGWRAAGLHKPSVASAAEHVVSLDELGAVIGELTAADRRALDIPDENDRGR